MGSLPLIPEDLGQQVHRLQPTKENVHAGDEFLLAGRYTGTQVQKYHVHSHYGTYVGELFLRQLVHKQIFI